MCVCVWLCLVVFVTTRCPTQWSMFLCLCFVFVSVLAFVFVCGCVCDYTVPDPMVIDYVCVLYL